jgi:hypothetical protein
MLEKIDIKILNSLKRWVIYKALRANIKRRNKELNRSMEFYPESKTAFEITKIQSRKNSAEVEYAPVSHEFYISNGEKHIILKQNSISMINGVYHYYVDMPNESMKYLDKYIKRILERRRSKKKKKIETNIIRSLSNILENLKIEETNNG